MRNLLIKLEKVKSAKKKKCQDNQAVWNGGKIEEKFNFEYNFEHKLYYINYINIF